MKRQPWGSRTFRASRLEQRLVKQRELTLEAVLEPQATTTTSTTTTTTTAGDRRRRDRGDETRRTATVRSQGLPTPPAGLRRGAGVEDMRELRERLRRPSQRHATMRPVALEEPPRFSLASQATLGRPLAAERQRHATVRPLDLEEPPVYARAFGGRERGQRDRVASRRALDFEETPGKWLIPLTEQEEVVEEVATPDRTSGKSTPLQVRMKAAAAALEEEREAQREAEEGVLSSDEEREAADELDLFIGGGEGAGGESEEQEQETLGGDEMEEEEEEEQYPDESEEMEVQEEERPVPETPDTGDDPAVLKTPQRKGMMRMAAELPPTPLSPAASLLASARRRQTLAAQRKKKTSVRRPKPPPLASSGPPKPKSSSYARRLFLRGVVRGVTDMALKADAFPVLAECCEDLMADLAKWVDAVAEEGGRKSLKYEDVANLLKDSGHLHKEGSWQDLVRKELPMEMVQRMIPVARSYNLVMGGPGFGDP